MGTGDEARLVAVAITPTADFRAVVDRQPGRTAFEPWYFRSYLGGCLFQFPGLDFRRAYPDRPAEVFVGTHMLFDGIVVSRPGDTETLYGFLVMSPEVRGILEPGQPIEVYDSPNSPIAIGTIDAVDVDVLSYLLHDGEIRSWWSIHDTAALPMVRGDLGRVIVEQVPILRPALSHFEHEWPPDADEGEMTYSKVNETLGALIEALLFMPSTPNRDQLMARGFEAIDAVIDFDADVGFEVVKDAQEYEPFRAAARRWGSDRVQRMATYDGRPPLEPHRRDVWRTERDVIDLWGVRTAIALALQIPRNEVPGVTTDATGMAVNEGPTRTSRWRGLFRR